MSVKNAKLTIYAPKSVSEKQITHFVASKQNWINKHIKLQTDRENKKKFFKPEYGSRILFLGNDLIIKGDQVRSYLIEDNTLILPDDLNAVEIKAKLKRFYKKEAEKIIIEKVAHYSKVMNIKPESIRITSARTRWGSCSSKGNVNFSWYLMMAYEDGIDYIVVHELAHLKQMNHSDKFWKIVEKYIPDWKERRRELKNLNQRLLTEDWG